MPDANRAARVHHGRHAIASPARIRPLDPSRLARAHRRACTGRRGRCPARAHDAEDLVQETFRQRAGPTAAASASSELGLPAARAAQRTRRSQARGARRPVTVELRDDDGVPAVDGAVDGRAVLEAIASRSRSSETRSLPSTCSGSPMPRRRDSCARPRTPSPADCTGAGARRTQAHGARSSARPEQAAGPPRGGVLTAKDELQGPQSDQPRLVGLRQRGERPTGVSSPWPVRWRDSAHC